MSLNAAKLEAGSYQELYPALGERNTLLALTGYYASQAGDLTAKTAIAAAKMQGYAALSDKQLWECLLDVLANGTPALTTPVLSYNSNLNLLSWTDTFTPYYWQTWYSPTGTAPFTMDSQFPGNVTSTNPRSGLSLYYYVIGVASDGVTSQTQESNIVLVP